MTLAILCSGQGQQNPDIFALTGKVPEAAGLFAHAAVLLDGRDPRDMVRTVGIEALHHNRAGQILCVLQALTAATALRNDLPDRLIVAGYSVGEVAAWGVAGLLDMTETLDLVAARAEAMDAESHPGDGLLFVRGLSRPAVDGLCARHDAAIAIINPGDAYLIGAGGAALDAIAREAVAMKARRVAVVPVEVASHTKRLAAASTAFRALSRHVSVRRPPTCGTRLLSGIDGAPVMQAEVGLDKLAAQISQTVQWTDCLQACVEAGATAFLELGPGRALSEMVTEAFPAIPTRPLCEFRTLDGMREWLSRHVDR